MAFIEAHPVLTPIIIMVGMTLIGGLVAECIDRYREFRGY